MRPEGGWFGLRVCALSLCAAAAAAAAADSGIQPDPGFDFSGYRIPSQNWRSWFVSGAGSGNSSNYNDDLQSARNRNAAGSLATGIGSGHDSDPLFYDWNVRLQGLGSGVFNSSTTATGSQDGSNHAYTESWSLNGQVRSYPWEPPVGLTAFGVVSGNYLQSWLRNDVPPIFVLEQSIRMYDYDAAGVVGAGFGRVRDAGNVYRAWLFERRLVRDGTLIRPLSPEARARLADLFSVQYGFGMAHQYPDKAFWSEVEKLVREDGALPDSGMAAYGLMHALDPMVGGATYDVRDIGWFAGPSLSGSHAHSVNDESVNGASARTERSADQVMAGATGEYHRPIGIGWQIDLNGSAYADVKGFRWGETSFASARLQYRFAERWLAWLQGQHQRNLTREEDPVDAWFVRAETGAAYQLEDHWRLSLTLSQYQFRYPHYNRQLTGSFGVTWSWGRFDAPGLVAPVRPLPVGPP